jgi:hypothetical protein
MSIPVAARVLVAGVAIGVATLCAVSRFGEPSAPADLPVAGGPADGRAGVAAEAMPLAVLHDWDARRAAAWSAGDLHALARLYTARSAAGDADVALLRRYVGRGLRVRQMQMQVLGARVLVVRRRAITLEVVDRLAGAIVDAGGARRRLPGDVATTHRLELRLVGGRWRMDQVAAVGSGRADP